MFGVGVCRPENATLLDGPNYTCRIKGQSFKVSYDKAIVTEWSTAKWAILLSQYEMQFPPQKAMKGQVVADFLAEHPDPRATKLYEDLPDEVAKVCLTQTSF